MKNLSLLLAFMVIGWSGWASPDAHERPAVAGYGDAFIFVEGGVEFAVYPDGQFDFFYNSRGNGYHINVVTPHVNISYNAGYNYDPYVQYDDFGAVIQIEHVPVFYDYYGRIVQAGNVFISYNHFGMISRIGNLHFHYNHNRFSHYSGYINAHNRRYVYRPWHDHYRRPPAHFAVVLHQPYRAYYHPHRVAYSHHKNYYRKHYNKGYQKRYYRPGQKVTAYHRGTRTAQVRDLSPRRYSADYSESRREKNTNAVRSNTRFNRERVVSGQREVRSNSRGMNSSDRSVRNQTRERNDKANVSRGRTTQHEVKRTDAPTRQPARVQKSNRSKTEAKRSPRQVERNREVRSTQRVRKSSGNTAVKSRAETRQPQRSSSTSRSSRGRGNI